MAAHGQCCCNLRSEEVQDALNLPNDGYALEKLRTDTSRDGNWFHFFKKKRNSPHGGK